MVAALDERDAYETGEGLGAPLGVGHGLQHLRSKLVVSWWAVSSKLVVSWWAVSSKLVVSWWAVSSKHYLQGPKTGVLLTRRQGY